MTCLSRLVALFFFLPACLAMSPAVHARDGGNHRRQKAQVAMPRPRVYVCGVARNENFYIREWVEYHLFVGATAVVVFDHMSTVPQRRELEDYIADGRVIYIPWSAERSTSQVSAYSTCTNMFRADDGFVAFIDVDEFIVIKQPRNDLPGFLKDFADAAGVVVHQRVFGTSGVLAPPSEGVLRSFTKCLPENDTGHGAWYKTIGRSSQMTGEGRIHSFSYIDGQRAVDENKNVVPEHPPGKPQTRRIVLHHYISRSLQDARRKSENGSGAGQMRSMDEFQSIDSNSTERCTEGVWLSDICCPSLRKGRHA